MHDFDQTHRLLLHLDDEAINQRPEVAPEVTLGMAMKMPKPVLYRAMKSPAPVAADPLPRGLQAEDFDHPDHGAEQPSAAIEAMVPKASCDSSSVDGSRKNRLLDRFLHHFPRIADITQAGSQYPTKRRSDAPDRPAVCCCRRRDKEFTDRALQRPRRRRLWRDAGRPDAR